MKKWPTIRIADEFSLQMGKTPARDNPAYWGGDQNWAAISDIARSGMYLTKTKETISQTAVDESGIKVVPPDTIVMSFKLSIGRTAITTSRMYTNEAIMAFLPHDASAFDLHFLYHLFSNRDWSEGSNKAVKGMTLNKATLNAARIPKPDISEQRSIASILDKLCGLVEKCDGQLERLDQLVKSRFVEMFGDPITNPKEWPMSRIGDHLEFLTSGSRGWAKYYSDDGELFITIKNVKGGKISVDDVQHVKPPTGAETERTRVQEGDLLISITADLGRTGIVTRDLADQGAYINQHLSCVRLDRKSVEPLFAAFYLESAAGKAQFEKKNQSAVKAGLNFEAIRSLRFYLPPLTLQREFAASVAKVDKLAFAARRRRDLAQQMYRAKIQEFFG